MHREIKEQERKKKHLVGLKNDKSRKDFSIWLKSQGSEFSFPALPEAWGRKRQSQLWAPREESGSASSLAMHEVMGLSCSGMFNKKYGKCSFSFLQSCNPENQQ